ATNLVASADLKERPDGATHRGAVVNDKDSGCAHRKHGSGNYYGSPHKTRRVFACFRLFCTVPFAQRLLKLRDDRDRKTLFVLSQENLANRWLRSRERADDRRPRVERGPGGL